MEKETKRFSHRERNAHVACKAAFVMLLLLVTTLNSSAQEELYVKANLMEAMQPTDRAALLMVHFGTTHDDTRTLTTDATNKKAQDLFPDLIVREAYTSRIIIRILKKRGIDKPTPIDALLRLRSEGFTHVIVQSTNIIDGEEMESLRRDVESVKTFFKEIRVGTPLLYSTEDASKVADIIGNRQESMSNDRKGKNTAHYVLVGHGTYTPSTAIYSQMDYMLKAQGWTNFHVGTIEGYPTYETMLAQLKASGARKVTLVPFMFVAGDHAKNDIAKTWKEMLEKEGMSVSVRMEGLGEIPEIQDIFMEHIRFSLNHRLIDIMEKKKGYAEGK